MILCLIFNVTKYFNAGQVAPENMLERFANTIGKGASAGLPLTGLLGYLSATKTLAGPLVVGGNLATDLAVAR